MRRYQVCLAVLCLVLGGPGGVSRAATGPEPMPEGYAERLVSVIYRIEGGSRTAYPYGIRSIKTSDPRRVCLNTVRNNWKRWRAAGSPGEYLDFLADRYCPAADDPVGNRNWKRNVRELMK